MTEAPAPSPRSSEYVYRDFSWVTSENEEALTTLEIAPGQDQRAASPLADGQFPLKLFKMLEEIGSSGLDHIVSWQQHGRCFMVHKKELFVHHILPQWFRQSKFPSFQRQLNLYGFRRMTTGRDKGAYYHELFLRGKQFLVHRIQRTKLKGSLARTTCTQPFEPNFYTMPHLPSPQNRTDLPAARPAIATSATGTVPLVRVIQDSIQSGLPFESLIQRAISTPADPSVGEALFHGISSNDIRGLLQSFLHSSEREAAARLAALSTLPQVLRHIDFSRGFIPLLRSTGQIGFNGVDTEMANIIRTARELHPINDIENLNLFLAVEILRLHGAAR